MTEPGGQTAIAPWAAQFSRPLAAVAEDLGRFEHLLQKWQKAQNLVSRETLDAVWTRHFADSLQILPLLPDGPAKLFDLGSGGGLPALPLAIATLGTERRFLLCESNARKVAFLRTVIREMSLDASAFSGRIEDMDSRETGQAEIVFVARVGAAQPLVRTGFSLDSSTGYSHPSQGTGKWRRNRRGGCELAFRCGKAFKQDQRSGRAAGDQQPSPAIVTLNTLGRPS